MELVQPSIAYRDSYLAAKREEGKVFEKNRDWIRYDLVEKDFSAYVQTLADRALGKGLPPGYVPDTRLWLVDRGEYIGSTSIRHDLNEYLLTTGGHIGYNIRPSRRMLGYGKEILRLALPEARGLGLRKVLLTCDETNTGSRKIIEVNGGVFEDKRPNPDGGPDKLRYWIVLP